MDMVQARNEYMILAKKQLDEQGINYDDPAEDEIT